jgi:hypothetical protein
MFKLALSYALSQKLEKVEKSYRLVFQCRLDPK